MYSEFRSGSGRTGTTGQLFLLGLPWIIYQPIDVRVKRIWRENENALRTNGVYRVQLKTIRSFKPAERTSRGPRCVCSVCPVVDETENHSVHDARRYAFWNRIDMLLQRSAARVRANNKRRSVVVCVQLIIRIIKNNAYLAHARTRPSLYPPVLWRENFDGLNGCVVACFPLRRASRRGARVRRSVGFRSAKPAESLRRSAYAKDRFGLCWNTSVESLSGRFVLSFV